PRFEGIGGSKLDVVVAWVRKEASNLSRALDAGVRVPRPLGHERNVLAMEFVGTAERPAPRLHDVPLDNPGTAYEVLATYVERLYDAGLVHGDLSEYNVLVDGSDLVVIDLGQAVTLGHPNADELLRQDLRNLVRFFSERGVDADVEDLHARVTADGDD
ncbi:MAG: RIO1 family regulatory kinase/ATPase, partial [Halobacteriota archaeon]